MKKWLALLVSCLALTVAFAGCGDDENQGDSAATTETTEQPADTASDTETAVGENAIEVSMKNTEFIPTDVNVKVGDTIKWTNDDPFPHTVTKGSGPGPRFDSGTVDGGGTYERKFTTAGKIDYLCTIHPRQTGTITVE